MTWEEKEKKTKRVFTRVFVHFLSLSTHSERFLGTKGAERLLIRYYFSSPPPSPFYLSHMESKYWLLCLCSCVRLSFSDSSYSWLWVTSIKSASDSETQAFVIYNKHTRIRMQRHTHTQSHSLSFPLSLTRSAASPTCCSERVGPRRLQMSFWLFFLLKTFSWDPHQGLLTFT